MLRLLTEAQHNGYAVGAFNAHSLDMIPAIAAAAEDERSPLILEFSPGSLKFCGTRNVAALVKDIAARSELPIAMHLDHGDKFEQVVECIDAGFSSVMIDGSRLSFEENIALTKRVVETAKVAGVTVEAELGHIGGTEDSLSAVERSQLYTDPALAADFVHQTGVDCLAVAIGTAHGFYTWEPNLDFERLAELRRTLSLPLVLHGASDLPLEQIQRAVKGGVQKINIASDLKAPWAAGVRQVLTDPKEMDPRKILAPANQGVRAVVREKMRLFGCAGRA
jgi:ketose-bisphosphate aldolase